jgi:hypothetical protein
VNIRTRRALTALATLAALTAGTASTTTADVAQAPRAAPTMTVTSTSGIPHRDVGNITGSPAWKPGHPRGYTRAWARYLDGLVGQVTAADPDVVLHGGDMVEGRWTDYWKPSQGKPFGGVGTRWKQRRAVTRAGAAYYSWVSRRWGAQTAEVLWAVGDHEVGDMGQSGVVPPWRSSAKAFDAYKSVWRNHLGMAGRSQYAVLRGNVGVVTIDPFHRWKIGVVSAIQPSTLRWLTRRVNALRGRGADWIIVQCETPAVGPNNRKGSSGLIVRNGDRLWRRMEALGVDLYLTGEFHDDTVHSTGGRAPVQVVHGGSERRASWLDIHVYGDRRLDLELWESVDVDESPAGGLWAMSRMRARRHPVLGVPVSTGSATLWAGGALRRRSGRLAVEGLR